MNLSRRSARPRRAQRTSTAIDVRGIAAALGAAILIVGCGSTGPTAVPRLTASAGPPGSPVAAASAGLPSQDSSGSPSSAPTSPTIAVIARLQAAVLANPTDEPSQRDLGVALVQRVRETADPSLYAPAEAAFAAALALSPDDAEALVGVASIDLGKHRFADGLKAAERAIALSPRLVTAHAAKFDALVELGRYDAADTAAGVMFGVASNLTTLARESYLAELHGHLTAALVTMRLAAASPGLAPENTAYVQTLLGNLLVYAGDPGGAAAAYQAALALVPEHAPSLAGEGRLAVGAGHLDDAIGWFSRAAAVVPLPEYVIALGDAQAANGQADLAARSYALARAEIQLFKAAGVIVDVDLALLEADHGDARLALADAEAGYRATPTVRAADALAWAFHRLGRDREAKVRSDEALRLGSIDPILRYHAGAIAAALGDATTARRDLQLALTSGPGFSATGVAEVRRILATLG